MRSSSIPLVVQDLAQRVLRVLGEDLLGVYLYGSLTLGDFVPATSDYDVLVIVRDRLPETRLGALAALHRQLLRENPDAARLEGDYAPRPLLVPSGTSEPVPGFRRGIFIPKVSEIMLSADNLANLRQAGQAVLGPPPFELLPEITPDDVREAVRAMLDEIPRLVATEDEAARELLNLLRSWCALETGEPTTRSQGAAWALATLDPRWHPAIRLALAFREGEPIPPESHLLREALATLPRRR